MRKRRTTKRRTSKKKQSKRIVNKANLCKNIGSTQLEVNILKQRIQQIHQKNLQLTKKKNK